MARVICHGFFKGVGGGLLWSKLFLRTYKSPILPLGWQMCWMRIVKTTLLHRGWWHAVSSKCFKMAMANILPELFPATNYWKYTQFPSNGLSINYVTRISWFFYPSAVLVTGGHISENQTRFLINRPGLFYGQCSEIYGANHSFIPIPSPN